MKDRCPFENKEMQFFPRLKKKKVEMMAGRCQQQIILQSFMSQKTTWHQSTDLSKN